MQNVEAGSFERLKAESPLLIAAAFAFVWLLTRAYIQSITFDEANTYLWFAAPLWPAHWSPSSNNHVLNTALIRLFTSIFGLSHFTVRIPALIGAAIYIALCLWLSRLLASTRLFRLALFVCLTYNPIVQDYLVAARGYSLALAFFTAAVAIVIRVCIKREASTRMVVIASVCAGLSFCSNFSFAFANAVAIVALICCCWHLPRLSRQHLIVGALFPGIAVTILICGYTLQHWPKDQLYYGAKSLRRVVLSVLEPSLYEPNPFLINPLIMSAVRLMRRLLPIAFLVLIVTQLVLALLRRAALPILLCAMLLATSTIHGLAFKLFGLLLPQDRTALFFVPLLTLLLAAVAAEPSQWRLAAGLHKATIVWFAAMAIYFIGCLRLSYFKEWKYDADTRAIYLVLNDLNRQQLIGKACLDSIYIPCVNFYSRMFGATLPQYPDFPRASNFPPQDRLVYVLPNRMYRRFIESQHLHVIYKGEISDAVVAVRATP
jgi:hypothetical protein